VQQPVATVSQQPAIAQMIVLAEKLGDWQSHCKMMESSQPACRKQASHDGSHSHACLLTTGEKQKSLF